MLPQVSNRVSRELSNLRDQIPSVVARIHASVDLANFQLSLRGPDDTIYEGGVFELNFQIPEQYPDVPPVVRFVTRIYHPNVDSQGRICLSTLNSAPLGNWDSRLTFSSICLSIQLLMAEPNPDDALVMSIAKEFRDSRELFNQKAKDCTQINAVEKSESINPPKSENRKRRRSSMGVIRKRSQSLATIAESDSEENAGTEERKCMGDRKIVTVIRRRERRKSEPVIHMKCGYGFGFEFLGTGTQKSDRMDVDAVDEGVHEALRCKRRLS